MHNRGRTCAGAAITLALALVLLVITVGGAFAAAPNAGQTIGNQASATYSLAGIPQPAVSSNTVTTTVQQVAGLTITNDQTKSIAIGGTVYFLHTVTNTGNGSDTFNLTAVAQNSGSPNLSVTTGVYADAGGGNPGAALSPSQTTSLARGASFTFYVGVTATSSTLNSTNTVKVTATSQFNNLVNAYNTDTVNLSQYAVLNFLKFATANTGKSGDTVTYTIRYTNNGNNPATAVNITDAIPTGMSYVTGSARWTITGATPLTDGTGDLQGTGPTIDYSYNAGTKTVTAIVSQVPTGGTADLTFQVTVNAGLGPQVITNIAHYIYNNGSVVTPDATVTADFTINTVRSVLLDDNGSTTDSDGSQNGIVTIASAPQGGVVWFDNVIHNTGNVADTYQMSNSGSTFPAGSNVQYYDGLNGSLLGGQVTGSVPANGGTYHVWVKITLPMNTGGGGPYTLALKATSSGDNTVTSTDTDKLTTIVAASMDITNNSPYNAGSPAPGQGPGPEGSPVTTTTGSSSAPAVFSLYLNNVGQTPETFTLTYGADATLASALPAGWTVTFNTPTGSGGTSCSTYGAALTGNITAIINGAANSLVCAVVTPAAGAVGGVTQQVYFKATGTSTGASDIKHDAVTTSKAYSLTLTPNNTGTIVPNGTKVYTHNLCNTSNVAVGLVAGDLTIATAGDTGGFSSQLYLDAGLTTQLTDVNQFNTNTGIPANTCVTVYVKVNAPNASSGTQDITTINVTSTKGVGAPKVVATATDTSTISMALTISKAQVIAPCNTVDPSTLTYTTGNLTGGAIPGACIFYQLVVNNVGSTQATTVTITDGLTPYTGYSKGAECFPFGTAGALGAGGNIGGVALAANQISEPTECAAGGTVTFGPTGHELTLNAGALATLYFRVEIQK
jgi:uncharacterized repeat protein (TIGR01451 family)